MRVLLLAKPRKSMALLISSILSREEKIKRDDDQQGVLEAVGEFCLVGQIQSAGLLGQADIVVIPLDVGEVAQGQGDGEGGLVIDAQSVERGGKLAGVGGQQEDDPQGMTEAYLKNLVTW